MLSISDIYAIPGEEQSTKTNNSTQDKQTIQATLKNEITPYKCSACQRAFTKQGYLNRHNCDKTSEQKKKRALECDQCDACFYNLSKLTNHKRTHTNERNYLCMICKFLFKHKHNLTFHVKTQHPKLFTSEIYRDCFTSTEEMEQYKNSFLCKKQFGFECTQCDASFDSNIQLIQHQIEVHQTKGKKLYQCNYPGCNQLYTNMRVFEKHKLLDHLPCGWQAEDLKALKLHKKSCPQCQNHQIRDEGKVHNCIKLLTAACPQIIAAIKNSLSLTESRINDKNCDAGTSVDNTLKENILKLKKLFRQFKFVDSYCTKNKNLTKIDTMYSILVCAETSVLSNLSGQKDLIAYTLKEINTINHMTCAIFADWQLTLQNKNYDSTEGENFSSCSISGADFSLDDYFVILPDQPEWQQTDSDILSDLE